MKKLDIYEVEYSVSPGGIDCWEISERDGDFIAGDFATINDAITYLMDKYGSEAIDLRIRSLEWLYKKNLREKV